MENVICLLSSLSTADSSALQRGVHVLEKERTSSLVSKQDELGTGITSHLVHLQFKAERGTLDKHAYFEVQQVSHQICSACK